MTDTTSLTFRGSEFRVSRAGTFAGSRPLGLEIADNAFVRMCSRCPQTYTVATRRVSKTTLCQDCRDVLTPQERRAYKSTR